MMNQQPTLRYESMQGDVLQFVPSLKGTTSYKDFQEYCGGEPLGNYPFFNMVIHPILENASFSEGIDDMTLTLFDLFEAMCHSKDRELVNLVYLELAEWMLNEPHRPLLFWSIMKPATRAMVVDAASRLGLINMLPGRLWSIRRWLWKIRGQWKLT